MTSSLTQEEIVQRLVSHHGALSTNPSIVQAPNTVKISPEVDTSPYGFIPVQPINVIHNQFNLYRYTNKSKKVWNKYFG